MRIPFVPRGFHTVRACGTFSPEVAKERLLANKKKHQVKRKEAGKCQRCSNKAAVVDGKVLARCDVCREAHNKRRNRERNT